MGQVIQDLSGIPLRKNVAIDIDLDATLTPDPFEWVLVSQRSGSGVKSSAVALARNSYLPKGIKMLLGLTYLDPWSYY